MQDNPTKKAFDIGWRARLPVVARALAILMLVTGLVYVGISYYRNRNKEPFRMRGEAPVLSRQVTSVIEGYERRVMDNERLSVLVRAARDITYSDNHHELEEVHLEVYPENGDKPDQISPPPRCLPAGRARLQESPRLVHRRCQHPNAQRSHGQDREDRLRPRDGDCRNRCPVTFVRENVSGRSRA